MINSIKVSDIIDRSDSPRAELDKHIDKINLSADEKERLRKLISDALDQSYQEGIWAGQESR
jgi:hypothetical protein